MQIKLKTIDDVEKIYQVTPSAEVAFEREMKGGFHKIFRDEEKNEHLYWLLHRCVKDSGDTTLGFDEWLKSVKAVEVLGDNPNGQTAIM